MFIPAGRGKILGIFLNEPFKEMHMREIARLSHVSLTNVEASLRSFVKEGLFKRRDISVASSDNPMLRFSPSPFTRVLCAKRRDPPRTKSPR